MKKQKLLVNFILDRSGSMETCQTQTISGFNEYLQDLKKNSPDSEFTLTLFNTEILKLYIKKPIKEVKLLNKDSYNPNGSTALYDAVVETVEKVCEELEDKDKPKSLVVIMTDGEENSSKEHNEKCLKDLIEKLQKEGNWTFVFLGANQDSWLNASQWGLASGNVVNYSVTNTGKAFQGLTASTMAFADSTSTSTSNFFKDKDYA